VGGLEVSGVVEVRTGGLLAGDQIVGDVKMLEGDGGRRRM